MPEKEKSRDIWDKLQISGTLLSSLLIGILGIYFTHSYNESATDQTKIQQAAQMKLDSLRLQTQTIEAQAKIQAAQLQAMTKLAPYLASEDKLKRNVGYAILQSVDSVSHVLQQSMQISFDSKRDEHKQPPGPSVYGVVLGKIKESAEIATDLKAPYKQRITAYDNIVQFALNKKNASIVKNAAANAIEAVRNSPNSPMLGIPFDLAEFEKYVDTLTLKEWRPSYVVLHHTAMPDLKALPNGFNKSNVSSFIKYLTEQQGWTGTPHLFIDDHKIWVLNRLTRPGVHSISWNKTSIGISMLGNYDVETTVSGRGKMVMDNAAAAIAILEKKFNISADSLKMHSEDKRTRKTCPGVNVDKSKMIAQSKLYVHH